MDDPDSRGLSRVRYQRLMEGTGAPAAATIMRRWGNWSDACAKAGIRASAARRSGYVRKFTDEDIIQAVAEFIAETGRTTYHAYVEWARSHGRPSGPLLVQRHRCWADARRKAIDLGERGLAETTPTPDPDSVSGGVEEAPAYEVRSNSRTFRFRGVELASSTSYRNDATRWVEFRLYRTEAGTYVLSRIGRSLAYHVPTCGTATRNALATIPLADLHERAEPCGDCRPDLSETTSVAVEAPRYWALPIDAAAGVVAALHKSDASGARYLTAVAARLLDEAALVDSHIAEAYLVTDIA
jgi:hypothetical protein